MDSAGRIVLPAPARRRRHLQPGSKFLISELPDGRFVLLPLDVEQLAKQIRKEMEGFDVDAAVERVKKEMQALAEERYPELAARMKKRR